MTPEQKKARDQRLAKSRAKERDLYAARGYTVSHQYQANGRHIDYGTELTVQGIGRVRFVKHVLTPSGAEWVDALSPGGWFRSFTPDRINTVHRINKIRENGAGA